MTLNKKYCDIEVTITEVPSAIISCRFYELGYEWLDTETDNFISGNLSTHGFNVIDFDGCNDLPGEVKRLLYEYGFDTSNL